MEDEFLAPTEISFTTPFKQAYRAPMGNGNADDSYESNERYNCDDDDDDDLNFISSNMQNLALSEKKGRNRRQNVSGVSPNSGPGLNLTFDMGVAESKENSVQEESPSFLNFGGGGQPATVPVSPGSAQKVHARSAHASPSCPTTTAASPGSASPRNPDPGLTSAITPPSEGSTKKQIITPLGVCTETEKSEKLCARFPSHDLNTSGQNHNSFPREIDAFAQKLEAKNCNIETQKQINSLREQFAAEQKLYEDFCIPQSTPSRGLNISVLKQDSLEDFDVDYLEQCSPHEILTNEGTTPPREHNVSAYQQDAAAENLTILNENFSSFNTQQQRTPSREITDTQIENSPGEGEVLLQNQGSPEKFCSEPCTQLTPTHELALSTAKPSTPGSKYFDAETTEKERPGDVSMEKTGSPQQLFLVTKVENTPPREGNISSQTQYCTPQDFTSETEPQITSIANSILTDQREAVAENLTLLNENYSFNIQKERTPPPREINEQIQCSPREGEVLLQLEDHGSLEKFCSEPHTQLTPTHELVLSTVGKPSTPDSKYFDAETTEKERSGDVSMEKTGSPQQLFLETKVENTPPREVNTSSQTQHCTPKKFTSETKPQITSIQNNVSTDQQDAAAENLTFLIENFSIKTQKQTASPSREITETKIQSSPGEGEVLLQHPGIPEIFCSETHTQLTPTRELAHSTVKPSNPEPKYFDAETEKERPGDVSMKKPGSPQQLFLETKMENTPPREVNISSQTQYCTPQDFISATKPQITSIANNVSTDQQDAAAENLTILNENFSSLNTQKQRTPSREINETQIKSNPEKGEFLLQKQGGPEKFCSERHSQLTPTRELALSPEPKYFEAETEKERPGDVSMEKNGSPQQLFLETKMENTPPREVDISSQTQYCTLQDFTSETEPQIISILNKVSIREQESPPLSPVKQHQQPSERDNNTSVSQHGFPDEFNFEIQKQKSPSPPCELNVIMRNETHEDFSYESQKRSSSPAVHPSSQKQGSPQVIFEKQYQQTPLPELYIPAHKQEISNDDYFETQKQRSPPRETNDLGSQRKKDAKFSQKQTSPPATARDVSIQKHGSPAQLFSESPDERTLRPDLNVSGQKQPTSDPKVFICVSEKQSSPQRDISLPKQGNPQQLYLQTQNQSTPPREPNVLRHNHGESDDSTNKIEEAVTPFREQLSMTNPNTPLLVDFNASVLKQNTPSSWDSHDSKKKQSTGLHEPNVVIHKQVASKNFSFEETQKQATPPRDYRIPLQNPCTPLLVDFNVSAHKQRSPPPPPREINAVTVTQQQGTTQDYGVIINTMESLQLKAPPSGSSNSSNFSPQNPGTPLLVDFGNGVSSQRQRQRQNVQPQALRYNYQGEYSPPPPDRSIQTRKQSTPSPHAHSETSCTTPTSEPSLMGMKTPHPALKRLQDELLSQETILEEQVEAKDEILKQKELELATIYRKIDGLKSHKDKEGKTLIRKYEATIANYSTELENLRASFAKSESKNVEVIKDRDQTYSDLRNVENAYNDLMGKYLRAKEMVGSLADAERHYNSRDEVMLHCLGKREQKIELLKNQIQEMVELTYQEYDTKLREKRHDNENLRVRLMRMEMRVDTLENDIEQKTRENAQLHTLCDEIISGRVAE